MATVANEKVPEVVKENCTNPNQFFTNYRNQNQVVKA